MQVCQTHNKPWLGTLTKSHHMLADALLKQSYQVNTLLVIIVIFNTL